MLPVETHKPAPKAIEITDRWQKLRPEMRKGILLTAFHNYDPTSICLAKTLEIPRSTLANWWFKNTGGYKDLIYELAYDGFQQSIPQYLSKLKDNVLKGGTDDQLKGLQFAGMNVQQAESGGGNIQVNITIGLPIDPSALQECNSEQATLQECNTEVQQAECPITDSGSMEPEGNE